MLDRDTALKVAELYRAARGRYARVSPTREDLSLQKAAQLAGISRSQARTLETCPRVAILSPAAQAYARILRLPWARVTELARLN